MSKASPIQTSFNGGELSPTLEGRVDLSKYANGCSKMENFIPLVQGGARKRSGTRFVNPVKDSSKKTRLIPFEFSTTEAYILEFGNLYMRVHKANTTVVEATNSISGVAAAGSLTEITSAEHGYSNGDRVYVTGTGEPDIDGRFWTVANKTTDDFDLADSIVPVSTSSSGTVARVYEIATPYREDDDDQELDDIQFAQSADVLYLAHPEHAPRKLERTADASWTMSEIEFDFVPFSPRNSDEDLLATASAATGDGITLTCSDPIFTTTMVGSHFRLTELVESNHGLWRGGTNNRGHSGNTPGKVYYEGNVYSLYHLGGSRAGSSAPVHEKGVESDGRWKWEYLHSGEGYAKITAVDSDKHRATADVVKRLPQSTVASDTTITAADKTKNPVWITASGHGLEKGDKVWIRGVEGMTQINSATDPENKTFTVGRVGPLYDSEAEVVIPPDTFELDGIDPGTYGTFSAGAGAARVIKLQTDRWSVGAWSPDNMYPRTVTFFEDRLWWAGTAGDPQTMWASQTSDYENHKVVDLDESALIFTLNTDQVNAIEWINAGESLIIGTAGGEFVCGAANTAEPLVPGNVKVVRRSTFGSRNSTPPARIGEVLLFVQRAGRKVREFAFDDASGGYIAPDMTVMADHITASGITRMAFQQEPNRVLWATLTNGSLIAFTYERAQEVSAWHRHKLGGTGAKVESIASIPHPDGDQDQLWMIVSRTIGGATERHIEYIESEWVRDGDMKDAFFVDSGLTFSPRTATITGTVTNANPIVVNATAHKFRADDVVRISGVEGDADIQTLVNGKSFIVSSPAGDGNSFSLKDLDGINVNGSAASGTGTGDNGIIEDLTLEVYGLKHLEGQTVSVLADGATHPDKTVSGGKITLDRRVGTAQVGLPYSSTLQTMRIEAGGRDGTSQGKTKRITNVVVRVDQTGSGLLYGPTDTDADMDELHLRDSYDPMDSPPPLVDGDTEVMPWPEGYEQKGRVTIKHTRPLPCTITAIMPQLNTQDR